MTRSGDVLPRIRGVIGCTLLPVLTVSLSGQFVAAQTLEPLPSCLELTEALTVGQTTKCAEELYNRSTVEQGRSVKKCLGALEEIGKACSAANDKASWWGCKALRDLSYELFAETLFLLHTCQTGQERECDDRGRHSAVLILHALFFVETRFENTPAETMVAKRLKPLREGSSESLGTEVRIGEGDDALPPAWNVTLRIIEKVRRWTAGYVWQETHWLWLMDSIEAGSVVHTTWGPPEEWLKFGVHDAHSEAPLVGIPPKYRFTDHIGMRWEIVTQLLRDLRKKRGGGHVQVVEIGVFAGHLSHHLLRDCDFISLLGIDPYIGSDGTFPGEFSQTLDPDVAWYKANTVMEGHGTRAQLVAVTSEEAAAQVPDGSVDAIFVDGCHLYDCVKQDFKLWLPKMRRNIPVLVAGHDFSPQWPGVVRAVHEQRVGGAEVFLASDWMYWWFDQYS